eukprot:3467893-Pyramimonas_sp.AAC.1
MPASWRARRHGPQEICSIPRGEPCSGVRSTSRSPRSHRVRPIFARAHRNSPDMRQELRLVLRWWLIALGGELVQSQMARRSGWP